jgi:hypothetical protein
MNMIYLNNNQHLFILHVSTLLAIDIIMKPIIFEKVYDYIIYHQKKIKTEFNLCLFSKKINIWFWMTFCGFGKFE